MVGEVQVPEALPKKKDRLARKLAPGGFRFAVRKEALKDAEL